MRFPAVFLIGLAIMCALVKKTARAESSISLSPAGISLKGSAGQTATQSFTISNRTDSAYTFHVEVADVIVDDGERKFVTAGQGEGSIAALVTFPPGLLNLGPGENARVPVTFVLPSNTKIRAVAVFFRGEPSVAAPETKIRTRLSLGAVVDFTCSDQIQVEAAVPVIAPPTDTKNAIVTQELYNVGTEPFIVKGVAAFLSESGRLAGKATFEQRRMLPGEINSVGAEYAGTLVPGKYRVLCSLEYGGKTITNTAELLVP